MQSGRERKIGQTVTQIKHDGAVEEKKLNGLFGGFFERGECGGLSGAFGQGILHRVGAAVENALFSPVLCLVLVGEERR